jgi:hypothetical protein
MPQKTAPELLSRKCNASCGKQEQLRSKWRKMREKVFCVELPKLAETVLRSFAQGVENRVQLKKKGGLPYDVVHGENTRAIHSNNCWSPPVSASQNFLRNDLCKSASQANSARLRDRD